MKYGKFNLGQIEAVVNKLGGTDGARRFLAGELVVVEAYAMSHISCVSVGRQLT